DDARAAVAVDDVDRLLQLLLEQRADDARSGIGAAARAPRHDERDRPLRKGRGGDAGNDEGGKRDGRAAQEGHGSLREGAVSKGRLPRATLAARRRTSQETTRADPSMKTMSNADAIPVVYLPFVPLRSSVDSRPPC